MSYVEKIETTRIGINGTVPLTDKFVLMSARGNFIKVYKAEPKQLRVSPKSFNDLRAFAERYEYPFGFEVKVDPELEDGQWIVCNEETKVYAVEEELS